MDGYKFSADPFCRGTFRVKVARNRGYFRWLKIPLKNDFIDLMQEKE